MRNCINKIIKPASAVQDIKSQNELTGVCGMNTEKLHKQLNFQYELQVDHLLTDQILVILNSKCPMH